MKTIVGFWVLLSLSLIGASPLSAQTGLYTLSGGSASQTDQTFAATVADQSSIYVISAGNLTLNNVTTSKTGDSSNVTTSSQYGLNAGILVGSAGTVTINGGTINTAASGANGLFATGTNSKITMTNGTIVTTGAASHGVDVTYGGTIILDNVTLSTTGSSASAALSTDYGGGTVTANNVRVTTAGSGSPSIYSTGVITVTNSTLNATGGACGVIDGSNSIAMTSCTSSSKTSLIKAFRSTSGSGTATISIDGGAFTVTGGDAFLVTTKSGAVTANITVKGGATITASTGNLVNADTNSTVNLTLTGETLSGNLVADSTSTINASLKSSTALTGTATRTAMTIDSTSAWTASGASSLTSLNCSGTLGLGSLSASIAVSGTATLGGKLLVNVSSPAAGTYTVLSAGSLSGQFSGVSFSPALSSTQTAALSYTSTGVVLTITGTPSSGGGDSTTSAYLGNVSIRATAGSGANTLMAGFVLSGTGSTSILLRGVGPTLTSLGVSGALSDPSLVVYDSAQKSVATNEDWGNSSALSTAFTNAGAFSLSSGSKDAALLTTLGAGSYTAHVANATATTGTALAEVYDAGSSASTVRLSNISGRGAVSGNSQLIAGFVVNGTKTLSVLVRAVGPTLGSYNVSGVLANPKVTVYNSAGTVVASNDDWAGTTTLSAAFAKVGAFSLASSSKDAAVVVSLASGAYTAVVDSVDGTSGVALVEIYALE